MPAPSPPPVRRNRRSAPVQLGGGAQAPSMSEAAQRRGAERQPGAAPERRGEAPEPQDGEAGRGQPARRRARPRRRGQSRGERPQNHGAGKGPSRASRRRARARKKGAGRARRMSSRPGSRKSTVGPARWAVPEWHASREAEAGDQERLRSRRGRGTPIRLNGASSVRRLVLRRKVGGAVDPRRNPHLHLHGRWMQRRWRIADGGTRMAGQSRSRELPP